MTGQTTSTRLVRGLGALLLLSVLLVGVPAALWAVGGNPVPSGLPSWNEAVSALTHPDLTGSLLLGLVKILAWLGWATFALAVILEIPAAMRGVHAPRLRGFAVQQRTATALVATILAMGGIGSTAVATAGPVAAAPIAATQSVTADASATQDAEQAPASSTKSATERATYKVQRGDNLWSIAQDKLGDGSRYREIVELNVGVPQDDGYTLEKGSDWIEPGWTLKLPIPAEKTDATQPANGPRHHIVQPGESLSSIARDTLGDPERYDELLRASADTIQPDGSRLTDADIIQPGWTITIPSGAQKKAPESTDGEQQSKQDQ
jgi:nucleoid-associated protein YgaU